MEVNKPIPWAYEILGGILVLLAVGLRVYKAHFLGIVGDEAATYMLYAHDLETTLTFYTYANNHILNSILIYFTEFGFGWYDHFIRLPALVFGIGYCVATFFLIRSVIQNTLIRLLTLTLALFHFFVLDLTLVARGYGIALGAMAFQMLLMAHYARSSPISILPLRYLIGMAFGNFIAFSAMLTSAFSLASLNLVFLMLVGFKIYLRFLRIRWRQLVQIAAGLVILSLIPITLVYYRLYFGIQEITATTVQESLTWGELFWGWVDYMGWLLTVWFFQRDSASAFRWDLVIGCSVTAVGIVGMGVYRLRNLKGSWIASLLHSIHRVCWFVVLSGALVVMLIGVVGFQMSLGFHRSHVFLIPIIVLCFGIGVEALFVYFQGRVQKVLAGVIACLYLLLIFHSLPAVDNLNPIYPETEVYVGPFLRQLQAHDSNREWKALFTDKNHFLPLSYYNIVGYRVTEATSGDEAKLDCETPTQNRCSWEILP